MQPPRRDTETSLAEDDVDDKPTRRIDTSSRTSPR